MSSNTPSARVRPCRAHRACTLSAPRSAAVGGTLAASRAGNQAAYFWGNDAGRLKEFVWFDENADSRTHRVDTKKPNPWGLWHMPGLVWEWCQDYYAAYPTGRTTDPVGPATGTNRCVRGASRYEGRKCRSANRGSLTPTYRSNHNGFRIAASVVTE